MKTAYSALYLDDARTGLSGYFDYAMNIQNRTLEDAVRLFMDSGVAEQFGKGSPYYIGYRMGWGELYNECLYNLHLPHSVRPSRDKLPKGSWPPEPEWFGQILAFYQWFADTTFADIFAAIKPAELFALYPYLFNTSDYDAYRLIHLLLQTKKGFYSQKVWKKALDLFRERNKKDEKVRWWLRYREHNDGWIELTFTMCTHQAMLFVHANRLGYDMKDFIPKFLSSEHCRREWDAKRYDNPSVFLFDDRQLNLAALQKECRLVKGVACDEYMLAWIGYVYRLLQWLGEFPSEELARYLPFEKMAVLYHQYKYMQFCRGWNGDGSGLSIYNQYLRGRV